MKDVVITAIGSVSAAATDWAGLLAAGADGASAFSPWPEEAGPPGPTALIGQIKAYDRKRYLSASDQRVADKFAAIMTLAAGDALSAAGLLQGLSASGLGDQIATITGTSKPEFGGFYKFGQPVLSGQAGRTNPALFPYMARNVACGQMCITFGLRGYSSNMAAGPLSGLHAIARAYELLRTGRVAVALAGGGECLSKSSLRMNRILFKGHHRAAAPEFFGHQPALHVPAEGATMLVMETL
ncbi:MAG TPA: beta-ketoacyl synthase N-terminal-like domain-containing protein, partial [Magnetospirillum sp.]|nr:beta-ketoacyl synthase N-terminal-like domain-containing protein [Magnetospirillum sp.]